MLTRVAAFPIGMDPSSFATALKRSDGAQQHRTAEEALCRSQGMQAHLYLSVCTLICMQTVLFSDLLQSA